MALPEAKEKVRQLENAISKLDAIKKHLNHNALNIKGEIHSCVSHNLECLRGREVSLLGKVDEVVGLKEEALQQQQARLNQALGVLQTRMALMNSDSAVLDKQIAEILSQFHEINLSPGETPHVAFRADHMSLRECILNYGRVDSNALPLQSAFDNPGKPSASLPRHLEEYEDPDHHIFYKTVEELKEGSSKTKSITVNIPKLSTRMEDWLQKRLTPHTETHSSPVHPTTLSCSSSIDSKTLSTPGGTCSLNNWLSQIKTHADLEEEHDFEIVDNSRQSTTQNGKNGKLDQWLRKSTGYPESLDGQKQSQNIFRHIPSDSKFWLRQPHRQVPTSDEVKPKGFFHHISKEPSSWLRSRTHGKQMTPDSNGGQGDGKKDKSFVIHDKNIGRWLAQSSKPKQEKFENVNSNCCKQLSWLQTSQPPKPIPLEDICRANELCSSLSECVSKPNCLNLCQQDCSSGFKNGLEVPKVTFPLQLPLSQWLRLEEPTSGEKMDMDICQNESSTDEKESSEEDMQDKGMFSHISDSSSNQWLIKSAGRVSSETAISFSPNIAFKHDKDETNMWLQQIHESSALSQEACPKTCDFQPFSKPLSDSQWLIPSRQAKAPSKEEDDLMKEESEGWSICSSPASFSSEQFGKDVSVATSYMQNWVL